MEDRVLTGGCDGLDTEVLDTGALRSHHRGPYVVCEEAPEMDWILKYWIQELFAVIIAVLTWCVRKLRKKKTEYDVLREGILALLHDRLYQACSFFIARGWATLDDRENLEYLYRPYKALGGNGTGETLYHTVEKLPYQKEEEK